MTQNRKSKRAIRARMEKTGEKYTEARRAFLGSEGGDVGSANEASTSVVWPEDSLGWFTDQAYNVILLAADEARMLSHARVEPEHLLLAATRHGNVERLLAGLDRAIHDAILRIWGFGPKLELRPRRSLATEEVLRGAVSVAAARGVLGASTEHLLLALEKKELPRQVLTEVGITDVHALVDAHHPVIRPPVEDVFVQRRAAELAARGRTPPTPGPIPPIFERFTSQSRGAINAGIEHARSRNDPYVEPVHLLLGILHAETGVVATMRVRGGWQIEAEELVPPVYPDHARQLSTDIFSDDARRIVAEDVLVVAERLGYRALTTGHLLMAILEHEDERADKITRSLPDPRDVAAAVADALAEEGEA